MIENSSNPIGMNSPPFTPFCFLNESLTYSPRYRRFFITRWHSAMTSSIAS